MSFLVSEEFSKLVIFGSSALEQGGAATSTYGYSQVVLLLTLREKNACLVDTLGLAVNA